MQLSEASFVPLMRWAFGADGPSWPREDCWGEGTKGIFRTNHHGSVRGTGWEWVSSTGSTSKHAVPTEQEAAQTILGPIESRGQGEKHASVAGLSNHPIVVLFPPRGEFNFPRSSSQNLVLCRF